MKLRLKFSIVLSICVLFSVFFTTWVQSKFFVSDQDAYLNNYQSTLALYGEKQLKTQTDLLYLQWGNLIAPSETSLRTLVKETPGAIAAELWRGKVLLTRSDKSVSSNAPPAGNSQWALVASPYWVQIPSIRWIGRYGHYTAVLDLKREWLADAFEAPHGAVAQLVATTGNILFDSQFSTSTIQGSEVFDSPSLLRRVVQIPASIPQTQSYQSLSDVKYLGTFLKLPVEPALLLVIKTPRSAIDAVLYRTFLQSAWVALLALALSIAIGVLFSTTLTSPLQTLVQQMKKLAEGHFQLESQVPLERGDELGVLAKSFHQMNRELLKTREELKKTERLAALGKFSAAIAHEIKNPLGGILGNIQVIKRKLSHPAPVLGEIIEASNFIEEETLRANQTISDLLKFSRQEKPAEARINLNEQVRHTLAILGSQIAQAQVKLVEKLPAFDLFCIGSGDQLHEVLTNLILNALYAMKNRAEKTLSVELKICATFAELHISDTGDGITPENQKHIFEPFFTTKKMGEGTGLGLSICHGIILSHHGRIEVESDPGQGTSFTITLPLA